ncbi:hypothetical protein [Paenibacillus humicus]|uniref:hypothetical protein n=1 Tax=Paenibacillus humicus TaxID=412861 RepID=UPI003F18392B
MNGYQKYQYLKQLQEPIRDLVDFTAYEMVEGCETDIHTAFIDAQKTLGIVSGPELTPEIREAVMHIVQGMTEDYSSAQ